MNHFPESNDVTPWSQWPLDNDDHYLRRWFMRFMGMCR